MPDAAPLDPTAKARARRTARAARAGIPARRRSCYSADIAARCLSFRPITAATSAFVYLALELEVDTRPIVDTLIGDGKQVLIPRLVAGRQMRAVAFPGWHELRPGPMGILSPRDQTAFAGPVDAVLVPGLAFSACGTRLGYGGGFYDGWLGAHPQSLRIALAFDAQIFDTLPREPHDVTMTHIITQSRIIDCAP